MMRMSDAYDCDGCGACCMTWPVLVSDEDAAREGRITVEGKRLSEHLGTPYWRYQIFPLPFHDERCCFLNEEKRCEIYATRPRVCRQFLAGSERCQEARQYHDLPPLAPGSSADHAPG
jgi:Fe-S-cluster containining protein